MDFFTSLEAHFPEETIIGLKRALTEKRVQGLYLNTDKLSDEALLSRYAGLYPHPLVPHAYLYDGEALPMGKTLEHNLGAFYCMDPASMLAPYYLDPKHGERILDYCAAPGGKSIVSSLLMGNKGVILSNDLSHSRSLLTSQNVERMGRGNIAVTSGDLSLCLSDYEGYFDAILLDAPCSGSAMFRKEPKMMEDWTYGKVLRCAHIQGELLNHASTMLAPGGRILYSTCSFSYEEDEAVVLSFLKEHPDFQAVPLPQSDLFYRHIDLPEAIHVFPHLHPGEGQFVCSLRHKGMKTQRKQEVSHDAPKKYDAFVKSFGIRGDFRLHNGSLYVISEPLKISRLCLLRYGVKLTTDKDIITPDHALASFLPVSASIPLDQQKAYAYLRGETFDLKEKDGYAVVSFEGWNLGWVKVSQGKAKNHYPKGLRRPYR